jgi:two-component system chemotaxis sensor kinase CheA
MEAISVTKQESEKAFSPTEKKCRPGSEMLHNTPDESSFISSLRDPFLAPSFRYIIYFMSDYLDPNNEELLKDFFAEAEQQVEQLESNILVIESDPSNRDAIDEIFRAAHTLKGGSATVEMMELSHFTHSVEDVLDEIRSDKIKIDEDVVDLLLTSIDVIKAMLEERQNGSVYEENIDVILNKLNSYLNKTENQLQVQKKHL